MKKIELLYLTLVLAAALLAGCGNTRQAQAAPTDAEAPTPTQTTSTRSPTQAATQPLETEVVSDDTACYMAQLERYYTALSQQWPEDTYYENEMSALAAYYYAGDPLENVGYAFVDLNNDGSKELVIGAIMNAEKDPAIFEIWTLRGGEPVMLAQSGSRNRYYLLYTQEDGLWMVANDASNGAANFAFHYMVLDGSGELKVVQAVIFDAAADEENPWFMASDMDWDTSNDEPIDEATAQSIMDAYKQAYTTPAFIPFSQYPSQ